MFLAQPAVNWEAVISEIPYGLSIIAHWMHNTSTRMTLLSKAHNAFNETWACLLLPAGFENMKKKKLDLKRRKKVRRHLFKKNGQYWRCGFFYIKLKFSKVRTHIR